MMVSLVEKMTFSPAYGEQFEAKQKFSVESPQTLSGIQLYLRAQMQGVGTKTAAQVLRTLDYKQSTYLIPLYDCLKSKVSVNKRHRGLPNNGKMMFKVEKCKIMLRGYGLSTNICLRLVRKYKVKHLG